MANFDISDFLVFPLFPTTVGVTVIKEDLSSLDLIKNVNYLSVAKRDDCFISENQRILSNFEKEKDIVMSYFNKFKNEILKFETTDLEMTTSWATKITNKGSSTFHSHKNSCYSGVLYLDTADNGGEIEFEDAGLNPSSFVLNAPTEHNVFNYQTFEFRPQKNLVIFFPSYLRHRIKPYFGSEPRYSIAFNIIPVGKYGINDSTVDITLNT